LLTPGAGREVLLNYLTKDISRSRIKISENYSLLFMDATVDNPSIIISSILSKMGKGHLDEGELLRAITRGI